MKIKKLVSLMLAVLMTSALVLPSYASASNETTVKQIVEDYLRNLSQNMYLYEENDTLSLTAASLSEHDKKSDIAENLETSLFQFSDNVSLDMNEIQDSLSYIHDFSEYTKFVRQVQGITRKDLTLDYYFQNTEISGNTAVVEVKERASFTYTDDPYNEDSTTIITPYTVRLIYVDGDWKIADLSSLYTFTQADKKQGINLATEKALFNVMYSAANSTSNLSKAEIEQLKKDVYNIVDEATIQESPGIYEISEKDGAAFLNFDTNEETAAPLRAGTQESYLSYDLQAAIQYAETYWDDNDTHPSSIHTWRNEDVFYNYGPNGGDCQNFASQLVYTALGGTNDEAIVNTHSQIPSDNTGNYTWYGDPDFTGSTAGFRSCSNFRNYEQNVRNHSNETGLVTSRIDIDTTKSPSQVYNYLYTLPGCVLHVEGATGDYGHAIFCTKVTGDNWKNVYYYAHSSSARNAKVGDVANWIGATHPIIAIKPWVYRDITNCSGHTYSNSSDASCNNCGYNRLRIRPFAPQNYYNISYGQTVTVGGKALAVSPNSVDPMTNFSCYRMAMNIISPSGKSTWYQVNNTNSINKSYTFNEEGVYTILVAGRDTNPDTNPNSTGHNITFTIRIVR